MTTKMAAIELEFVQINPDRHSAWFKGADDEDIYLPMARIAFGETIPDERGEVITIEVEEWLAKRRGLI